MKGMCVKPALVIFLIASFCGVAWADGDAETYGECAATSDCDEGQTCRYDGRCIPTACTDKSDCRYDDFYCRFNDEPYSVIPLDGDGPDGDADANESPAEDGDTSKASGGVCAPIECVLDSDCPTDTLCRDEGRCVRNNCRTDDDCQYSDLHCRADGVCAPSVCVADSDCLGHEQCHQGSCIPDPTGYVEGGVGNCGSTPNAALPLWLLLLGGWFLARRKRA